MKNYVTSFRISTNTREMIDYKINNSYAIMRFFTGSRLNKSRHKPLASDCHINLCRLKSLNKSSLVLVGLSSNLLTIIGNKINFEVLIFDEGETYTLLIIIIIEKRNTNLNITEYEKYIRYMFKGSIISH